MNKLTVTDVLDGNLMMPYIQVSAWSSLQNKDKVINKLKKLIETGQKPEEKKTGGENTTLKNLRTVCEGKSGCSQKWSCDRAGL